MFTNLRQSEKQQHFIDQTVLSKREPKICVDSHKIQRGRYKIQSHSISKEMKILDLMLKMEVYFLEEGHARSPKVAK